MAVPVTFYFRDNTEVTYQTKEGLVSNNGGTMVGVTVDDDTHFYPVHSIRHVVVKTEPIHDAQGHTHEG